MAQRPWRPSASLSRARTLAQWVLVVVLAACGGGSVDDESTAVSLDAWPEALEDLDFQQGPIDGGDGEPPLVAARSTPSREAAMAVPVSQDPRQIGRFGAAFGWPLIPVHVALLPDGRVLSYGTDERGRQGSQFSYSVWDPALGTAANSHLVLPKPLQWITGNIGIHHVHHLSSRIPNYRLQECMDANPELQRATRITLRDAWRLMHLTLWDEESRQLVRFRDATRAPRHTQERRAA